jgi:hypothetical protein
MKTALVFLYLSLSTILVQAQDVNPSAANNVDAPLEKSVSTNEGSVSNLGYRASLSEKLLVLNPGLSQFTIGAISTEDNYNYLSQINGSRFISTAKTTGLSINHKNSFESGIMISFETTLAATKSSRTSPTNRDINFTGLSDLLFSASKISKIQDSANLIFGATVGVSPGLEKLGNSTTDGNRFSGGHAIRPFVGTEYSFDRTVLGGQLGYNYKLERESEFSPNNYTETETGGNEAEILAFGEYNFSNSLIGVSLSYMSTEARQSKYDDDGDKGSTTMDAFSTASGSIYGVVTLDEQVHLKPAVNYAQLQQSTLNDFKTEVSNTLDISVGLATTF